MLKDRIKIGIFFSAYHKYPPHISTICAPLILIGQICSKISRKKFKPILIAPMGSKIANTKIFSGGIKYLYGTSPQRGQNLKFSQKIIKRFLLEEKVDILNCHWPQATMPILQNIAIPVLFTFHDPLNQGIKDLIKKCDSSNYYYNFLSQNQTQNFPLKNKQKRFVIYNGVDTQKFKFNKTPASHALFAGRLVKDKGVDVAIRLTQKLNIPLKIAGNKSSLASEKIYWRQKIKPQLKDNIEYLGLVPYPRMPNLYRQAKVVLFPIHRQEPFGLVMAEAMACGTPVIATGYGSVPEIVKNGITGYIVKNEKEMIKAVKKIYAMPKDEYTRMRHACREHVEKKFTIEKMVNNYERAYYKVVKNFKQ